MKTYLKPKSISIKLDTEDILDLIDSKDKTDELDARRMSFRIIDDSDDWSDEDNF